MPPNYGDPRYWDERYKHQGSTFDWLENYDTLKPIMESLLDRSFRILNIGCGNAELTEAMYDDGYKDIWNMDISDVVIEQMKERNAVYRPDMIWEYGDALDMKYEDEFFDVVLDKSISYITRYIGCYSMREYFFSQCCYHDKRGTTGAQAWRNIHGHLLWKTLRKITSLRRLLLTVAKSTSLIQSGMLFTAFLQEQQDRWRVEGK